MDGPAIEMSGVRHCYEGTLDVLRAGVALPACTGQDVSLCVNRTSPPDVLPREALR